MFTGLAVVAGNAQAEPMTVRDDRGIEVRFDATPTRIVTLLPSLTETVCVLQACERLVGIDQFSNWPESIATLPRLGGLENTPIEALYRLAPDVVLASASARVIDRLESLGMRVLAFETQSLAQMDHTIDQIARLLERPEAAATLRAEIDEQVRQAAHRIPPMWHGARVYFEVSAVPFAASEASFVGELLGRLGLGNAIPARLGPFPKLNPEYVVRAKPDIMMASQEDLTTMALRPGWRDLHALQSRHVCGFETLRYEVLIRPGPRLGEAAQMLADCIAALPAR